MGDLNGDGYEDVVVGDIEYRGTNEAPYDGRALIYQGSASGLSSAPVTIIAPPAASAGSRIEAFGAPSLVGDVNADGFPDMLLRSTSVGAHNTLTIVMGNRSLRAMEVRTLSAPLDSAGYATRAGDFDGDGFGDVALGCGQDGACIRFGDSRRPLVASTALPIPRVAGPPIDLIGWAITSGDFDGDGFSDVVVYFRQCLVDHLAVYGGGDRHPAGSLVLRHPESDSIEELGEDRCYGSDLSEAELDHLERESAQFAPEDDEPNWRSVSPELRFGMVGGRNGLAASDLNLDGRDDLIVARPPSSGFPPGSGQDRFSVLQGGPTLAHLTELPQLVEGDAARGLPVAAGRDLTGDGFPDLLVSRGSRLVVYPSSTRSLRPMDEGFRLLAAHGSLRDVQGEGMPRLVQIRSDSPRCLMEITALGRSSRALVLPLGAFAVEPNCHSFHLE